MYSCRWPFDERGGLHTVLRLSATSRRYDPRMIDKKRNGFIDGASPKGHIRRISVHVDEPEPGHFYWVLMEEDGDATVWKELETGEDSYDIWLDALSAGCQALVRHVPDERIGPRLAGEDEDASPVGTDL